MGFFDKIFHKEEMITTKKMLEIMTAYQPRFTNWNGCLYESELVRSAIDARARHNSKLKVEFIGSAQQRLINGLKKQPNTLQTWSQFLYRTSTILDNANTCFIIPTIDEYNRPTGIVPVNPSCCELVRDDHDRLWLRYQFTNGQMGAMEYNRCAVMTKHQYRNDFFGENNNALDETMNLIHLQNQGIEEGVRNSATYRFMAKLNNFSKAEDLKNERERFTENNLITSKKNGGILLFPNTYDQIQQINSKPFTVDAEQMKLIQTNVYNYFGVNEDVLQNKAYGDSWSAFYEGAIEPFAVQLSETLSKCLYTERERAEGNEVVVTSNRLQYLSNKDKLDVSAQMADRGIMTRNEIREIWNLAPVDGGNEFVIRGEYYNVKDKVKGSEEKK